MTAITLKGLDFAGFDFSKIDFAGLVKIGASLLSEVSTAESVIFPTIQAAIPVITQLGKLFSGQPLTTQEKADFAAMVKIDQDQMAALEARAAVLAGSGP